MILTRNITTVTAAMARADEGTPDTIEPVPGTTGLPSLPEDLRLWLHHQALADLSARAVLSLEGGGRSIPAMAIARGSSFPGDRLLLLLTYCYAAGIYSSEDIEQHLETEPSIRQLCAGKSPDAAEIRRYRRTHRAEVDYCLGAVLGSACRRERHCARRPGQSEWGSEGPPAVGTWELPRRTIEGEVKRRVNWAVELDSMALDF